MDRMIRIYFYENDFGTYDDIDVWIDDIEKLEEALINKNTWLEYNIIGANGINDKKIITPIAAIKRFVIHSLEYSKEFRKNVAPVSLKFY